MQSYAKFFFAVLSLLLYSETVGQAADSVSKLPDRSTHHAIAVPAFADGRKAIIAIYTNPAYPKSNETTSPVTWSAVWPDGEVVYAAMAEAGAESTEHRTAKVAPSEVRAVIKRLEDDGYFSSPNAISSSRIPDSAHSVLFVDSGTSQIIVERGATVDDLVRELSQRPPAELRAPSDGKAPAAITDYAKNIVGRVLRLVPRSRNDEAAPPFTWTKHEYKVAQMSEM